MKVDAQRLATLLAERLQVPSVRLAPIDVRCAWPVFKAEIVGCPPMFVKVAAHAAAARTRAFLRDVPPTDFLPRCLPPEDLEYDGCAVLCLAWMQVRCVHAEDMTDAQFASFSAVCCRLSDVLSRYRGPLVSVPEDDPDFQYAAVSDYVARRRLTRPLARRLLAALLSIPKSARTYEGRVRTVIHGDFQPRNYGFDGNRLAAVFDFDALTKGLACEDAAYAFAERARRLDLTETARVRLTNLFLRLVAESPWPKDEWRMALNHARLRIAARRIASHPNALFVAFDIRRRDRPLLALAHALETCDA